MNGVNKVILIGIAGRDPERRETGRAAIANLSLATSERWTDKTTGERRERTEWHRVSFFGRLAEVVCEHVRKGDRVYVEGSLRSREWEKNGMRMRATDVIAREMTMLSGPRPKPEPVPDKLTEKDNDLPDDDFDDDIPF